MVGSRESVLVSMTKEDGGSLGCDVLEVHSTSSLAGCSTCDGVVCRLKLGPWVVIGAYSEVGSLGLGCAASFGLDCSCVSAVVPHGHGSLALHGGWVLAHDEVSVPELYDILLALMVGDELS